MEEALIQYIHLLLIVAIFHSSPPSFQTAGTVTQLQQLTCSEERGVTLLGLISLSLHKLHCSAGLSITWILLQISLIPHPGSVSCPRQPTTMDKDSYSISGQQDYPASRTAAYWLWYQAMLNNGTRIWSSGIIVLSSSRNLNDRAWTGPTDREARPTLQPCCRNASTWWTGNANQEGQFFLWLLDLNPVDLGCQSWVSSEASLCLQGMV